jgi:hypothetical protein
MPASEAELVHIEALAVAARKMTAARDLLRRYDEHSTTRRAMLEQQLTAAITGFLETRAKGAAQ